MGVDLQPRAEVVATVLERIAEYRYHVGNDQDGELIIIPDYGPTFLEREEYVWGAEHTSTNVRNGFQDSDFALVENWSDDWTLKLLDRLSELAPGPLDYQRLVPMLKGKSYKDVITDLYTVISGDLTEVEGLLEAGRETIPEAEAMELSRDMDELFSDDMEERLVSFHARRLSKLFPKIIDRAMGLALFAADYDVPHKVKRYMDEASKSYLNGQWIACLMVCRSAIEFAVKDRLQASGYGSELEAFEKSLNRDSLFHLIELAKRHLAWQYRPALEDAQKLREAAVCAVHKDAPHDDECRDLFLLTRTIMHMLYNQPEPL